MQKGIKIRLYPDDNQIDILNRIFGHTRFVYNYFLDYSKNNKDYKYNNWSKILTKLKNSEDTSFLKEADKFALQNALKNLSRAYSNFFEKRALAPKFKKKNNAQSYRTNYTNNNIVILDSKIKLPKLGYVKCRYNKDLSNVKIVNVTVKRLCSGDYEASIVYECEDISLAKTNKCVGIDLGVRKLITTSDNDTYISRLDIDRIDKKLKKCHKSLSKSIKDTKRYEKKRKRLAKIYEYKENYMNDIIHKVTKTIVTKYDIIYMENLDVKDLLSKQKMKKNKRKLIEASFGKIRRYLEYKCYIYDKRLITIDRYYASSQICSICDNKYKIGSGETYKCPYCNNILDRDYNAAINILKYGDSHN